MEPFPFTDSSGRRWLVYDFRVVDGKRRRVPLCDWRSEGRAFVAEDNGEVRIYAFGYAAYRSLEPKLLAGDFHFSKPLNANAAERMTGQ